MSYQYVVTAHKPSAVRSSIVGNFMSPDGISVVVNRFTHLDIMQAGPEGLQHMLSVPIYGRVASIHLFRPEGCTTDLLCVVVETCQMFVLRFDVESGEIVTHAFANCFTRQLKATANGQMMSVDPDNRMICLHLHEGQIKIFNISGDGRSQLSEQIDLRIEEKQIFDVKFLHNCKRPIIAILHEDKFGRHVVVYAVKTDLGEFAEADRKIEDVDSEACAIIPIPSGGFVVAGRHSVAYFGDRKPIVLSAASAMTVSAWGRIDKDGSRILLADVLGNLRLMVLLRDKTSGRVSEIRVEVLGKTSIASSLFYIDEGVVFVGSLFADSQLVKLLTEKSADGSLVEVLENFANVGPVLDMCVVDTEKQGQSQIVTCSGSFKDGSLRVVRNGIGLTELATVDLKGVRGVWCVQAADTERRVMALSFVGQTSFLSVVGEDMEGMEVAGADTSHSTLFFGDVAHGQWVQVTSEAVTLINRGTLQQSGSWNPPAGKSISVCRSNGLTIAVAFGGDLQLLTVDEGALSEFGHTTLPHEIACVALSEANTADSKTKFCAVGLWIDFSIRVLDMSNWAELHKDILSGDTIPRSLAIASLDGALHLMCGLGDGALCTYEMDAQTGHLSTVKRISLGTQPVELSEFQREGRRHVFALCDRPVVVYASHQKLMYSNVSQIDIKHMSFINTPALPECLVFVTAEGISIAAINEIQNLQIRKVPIEGTPWQIDHQQVSRTFLVATTNDSEYDIDLANSEMLENRLVLMDDLTFEILDSIGLKECETVGAVVACTLGPHSVYAVGSAIVRPDEDDPKEGYVRVIKIVDRCITELHTKKVNGGVYAMQQIGDCVVAAIGPTVMVMSWDEASESLKGDCGSFGQVTGIATKTRGNLALVGDIMIGSNLYEYKPSEHVFKELAKSPEMWVTSLDFIDDLYYLTCDSQYNLHVFKRNTESPDVEEQKILEPVGEFHLGHSVNACCHGTLTMRSKEFAKNSTPILFGTDTGAIGMVLSIPKEEYLFLLELQTRMRKLVKGVGSLDHTLWRSFKSERRQSIDGARYMIDGDLIETFLDLPLSKKQEVATEFTVVDENGLLLHLSVEQLALRVEDLTRLH
jgi:DNA damage-binding protein 1